ncbi:MAG: RNA polymerase sigma factor [Ilumatobacter fluminis]|uniref:RNA polymerase sigma factor n=1 Tax=Ilumatobacter fluminis TaxID=467091 RepID=UPI0032EBE8C0
MSGVDRAGFERCFAEHYSSLVGLGVSMTGSVEVGRDLAQETFVRAHREWDSLTDVDQLGGWLRRVMSNLLIDRHRSASSERAAVERLARERTPTVPLPDDGWWQIVRHLPAAQRMIVTMFYAEDASVETIASALEISPNTVKSALSKARSTLRGVLTEEHGR